jgi:hypothetical protein
MAAVVAGFYNQGRVELLETPVGIREGRVRVLLIEEQEPGAAPRLLTFGKYRRGSPSTPDDFQAAERRGEEEFIDLYGR